MYKIIVEAKVTVNEEIEVLTEYGDYWDSYTDEVTDPYLLKKFEFTEEDNLVEYVDESLQTKLTNTSLSEFIFKDNYLYINTEFNATKRLTKVELEKLKKDTEAQYSDGYYSDCYNKTIFDGKKYKEYCLCVDWKNVTAQQRKL